ncbi:MAG: hypothetical protein IH597_15155 [Bacteroidales bacterium]|nr:hypothetical protein [Bacteroidales bacterium]
MPSAPFRRNISSGYAFLSQDSTAPESYAMRPTSLQRYLILFLIATALNACDPKGDDGIPAYIHIEEIGLTTEPGQGTASHKITDAWVYIDMKLIGVFELPATFPVLQQGDQEVTIYAGIKINGIAATRSAYPFFTPIIVDVNLTPGVVDTISNAVVSYDPETTFSWMEDFDGALSIDTTSNSETNLVRISDPDLIFSFDNEPNDYSAMASVSGDTLLFECATIQSLEFPEGGKPVFLEMNYKNNHNLTVGLTMVSSGQTVQQALLVLNPSETWNKIYINLTPTISYFYNATDFRIFIGLLRTPETETATIYFDNLKLVY